MFFKSFLVELGDLKGGKYREEKSPDVNSGLKTESGAEKRHLWV